MKRVLVESPFKGRGFSKKDRQIDLKLNKNYIKDCLRDCLLRDEAPFASHALYALAGVLDDDDPEERELGIQAGFAWGEAAYYSVFYVNRGFTAGMFKGLRNAWERGREVHFRALDNRPLTFALSGFVQEGPLSHIKLLEVLNELSPRFDQD